jgi:hypothetical protein
MCRSFSEAMKGLLRFIISAVAGLAILLFSVMEAAFLGLWLWKLFPDGRAKLASPAGTHHAAFTYSYGFGDWQVGLYVRDWPFTFCEAQFLLQIGGEDGEGGEVRWTKDGTMLLVTEHVGSENEAPEVKMAYDYKDHRLIRRGRAGSTELERLVAGRGGAGPAVPYRERWIEEDESNGIPGTVIAPGLLVLAGIIGGAAAGWRLFFPSTKRKTPPPGERKG